jgi:hypothetical protein
MAKEQPDYLAYLLRLWRVRSPEGTVWRAQLESALTRERKAFASLDDLFDFLRRQTGVASGARREGSVSSSHGRCGVDSGDTAQQNQKGGDRR